jgi:hypothetical protein
VPSGSTVKELAGWLCEKVSRLKLRHDDNDGLGLFEALEFLEAGIHGKSELWRALAAAGPTDPRLRGINFEHLTNRAEKQRAEVESRRLQIAHFVFGPDNRQQSARTRDVLPRPRRLKARGHAPMAIGLVFAVIGACIGTRCGALYENSRDVNSCTEPTEQNDSNRSLAFHTYRFNRKSVAVPRHFQI